MAANGAVQRRHNRSVADLIPELLKQGERKMRKFLIPIAAAASMLAVAAPAAAQWAPPVYQYNPYNYGNGFRGTNFARSMADRVERIRIDIRAMQQHGVLSRNEARNLDNQARNLE